MIREGSRHFLLFCSPVKSVGRNDGLVGVPADGAAVAALYVHLVALGNLLLDCPATLVRLHQVDDEQREDEDGDCPTDHDSNEDLLADGGVNHDQPDGELILAVVIDQLERV